MKFSTYQQFTSAKKRAIALSVSIVGSLFALGILFVSHTIINGGIKPEVAQQASVKTSPFSQIANDVNLVFTKIDSEEKRLEENNSLNEIVGETSIQNEESSIEAFKGTIYVDHPRFKNKYTSSNKELVSDNEGEAPITSQ